LSPQSIDVSEEAELGRGRGRILEGNDRGGREGIEKRKKGLRGDEREDHHLGEGQGMGKGNKKSGGDFRVRPTICCILQWGEKSNQKGYRKSSAWRRPRELRGANEGKGKIGGGERHGRKVGKAGELEEKVKARGQNRKKTNERNQEATNI